MLILFFFHFVDDMMIVQSLAVSELVQPFIVKEIVTGFLDAEATAFTSKLLGGNANI